MSILQFKITVTLNILTYEAHTLHS